MLKMHVTAAYTHDGGVASVTHSAVTGDDVPQDAVGEAVIDALHQVHRRTNNQVPMRNITVVLTFEEA